MVENFLVTGRDRYSTETIGKPISDSRIARGQPDGVGCDARRTQASDDYDVISPVPMNPSCMSLSRRLRICQHSIRRSERADTWRVVGQPEALPFFHLNCDSTLIDLCAGEPPPAPRRTKALRPYFAVASCRTPLASKVAGKPTTASNPAAPQSAGTWQAAARNGMPFPVRPFKAFQREQS